MGLDMLFEFMYINREGKTGLIVHFTLTGTGNPCDCFVSFPSFEIKLNACKQKKSSKYPKKTMQVFVFLKSRLIMLTSEKGNVGLAKLKVELLKE